MEILIFRPCVVYLVGLRLSIHKKQEPNAIQISLYRKLIVQDKFSAVILIGQNALVIRSGGIRFPMAEEP